MTTRLTSISIIMLIFLIMLTLTGHSNQQYLSMKKGQANFMKMKAHYKIPPPVSGEVLTPRVVELMLVLHHDLYRYHGDDTINYITDMSNQAADFWSDVTNLGVNITIRITKTILIKDDTDPLPIEADANQLLRKFCADWQSDNKYWHQNEYDAMILITREDLHLNNNYNATGLAYMLGACDEGYRCAVVEDTGPMGTAITLAHELGHLLGMYHDGQFNGCKDRTNLMSGYTVSGVQSARWSTCSTQSLLEYLRMPRSRCLQNITSSSSVPLTTHTFPGQFYTTDHQCRIALGKDARACPMGRKELLCQHLKCILPAKNKCVLTNRPPLDGTKCAINKWCHRGQCIEKWLHHQRQEHKLVATETTTPMIGDTPSMKTTAASILPTGARKRLRDHL